jgi:23S rRNA pseudouridine1911/1915/1917 synthase
LATVHAADPAGKPAQSLVRVIERRPSGFLCDVSIKTGRPHQIRIHLAAAGHPLLGDPLYGAGGGIIPGTQAVPGDPGYLLHAAELRFRHPQDEREILICCPPPAALRTRAELRKACEGLTP